MNNIDITPCIKNLCTLLSDVSLSSGKPVRIYDGLLEVPDIKELTDLPIFIVDVADSLKISDGYSAQKYQAIVPIEVWYVITNTKDVIITDTLRKDGADLAKILHRDDLGSTVEILEVTEINSSNYNAINLVAMEEQANIMAVCVSMNASFSISKDDLNG